MTRVPVHKSLILLLILSACSTAQPSQAAIPASPDQGQAIHSEFVGRVVDDQGLPLKQANVKIGSTVALTDDQGWFHVPSSDTAQWLTIYKPGYITRTRAAAPGIPVLIRVSRDDGKTIVLKFTGDVMFGRRFFDVNGDGNTEDGLLPVHPSIEDHLNLLRPLAPLLGNSDITAINMESVLSETPYFSLTGSRPTAFHQTKDYVYATHPNAMAALMDIGVNMIGLGNNHVYDMLDPGMANTIDFLNKLGLPHFGAGMNESEAWAPAIATLKGQRVAFIGCTTIFVKNLTPKPEELTYVASDAQKKGGAAYCEKDRLSAAVTAARKLSDLVVVMIHGGTEYDQTIPGNPIRLTEIAEQAGASIVINHHPHVVSGFSWGSGKIIGRSLGNLIFDQTIWPTFESYMFTVYVKNGKVIRAFIEPVMLEDNISRGITGPLADYVAREAAGLETGPFIMESDTMEVDINHRSKQVSKTVDLDGGSGTLIQIPNEQWISGFRGSGRLQLGRDLLWVGGFENTAVEGPPGSAPLWAQNDPLSVQIGSQFAYEGQSGVRLSRDAAHQIDAVTTNLHRIPIDPTSQITVCGMFRASSGAAPSVQISWYPDLAGPSTSQSVTALKIRTMGTWQYFQIDLQTPANAVALQVFLRLAPPATGSATADFDNLRVIHWAAADARYGPLYDFAYLTGKGKLTFSQSVLPGGEQWMTVSNLDLSRMTMKQTP